MPNKVGEDRNILRLARNILMSQKRFIDVPNLTIEQAFEELAMVPLDTLKRWYAEDTITLEQFERLLDIQLLPQTI